MIRHALFTDSGNHTPLMCPTDSKVSFRSSSAASRFIADQTKAGRTEAALEPYKCPHCPHFHTTTVTLRVAPTPEHAKAHTILLERLEEGLITLTSSEARHHQAVQAADAIISADRWVRTQREATESMDSIRSRWRSNLRMVEGAHREQAERASDELVDLCLSSETWGWLVDRRQHLLNRIDAVTESGNTTGMSDDYQAYLAVAVQHVAMTPIGLPEFWHSEFMLLSDATAEWVEHCAFDEASNAVLDVLFDIEERAIRL